MSIGASEEHICGQFQVVRAYSNSTDYPARYLHIDLGAKTVAALSSAELKSQGKNRASYETVTRLFAVMIEIAVKEGADKKSSSYLHRDDLNNLRRGFTIITKKYVEKRSKGCYGFFRHLFYAIFCRAVRPETKAIQLLTRLDVIIAEREKKEKEDRAAPPPPSGSAPASVSPPLDSSGVARLDAGMEFLWDPRIAALVELKTPPRPSNSRDSNIQVGFIERTVDAALNTLNRAKYAGVYVVCPSPAEDKTFLIFQRILRTPAERDRAGPFQHASGTLRQTHFEEDLNAFISPESQLKRLQSASAEYLKTNQIDRFRCEVISGTRGVEMHKHGISPYFAPMDKFLLHTISGVIKDTNITFNAANPNAD